MPPCVFSPPSPLLPAFGIRELNGPANPPGVVQISARAYDSTIQSQPDATLSYVDLDDGEDITVGSSFELKQRLDEPVSQPTHRSRFTGRVWPVVGDTSEENQNKMHIFDIRHSSGSLVVWRDHEAYSGKHLRRSSTTASSSATSPPPVVSDTAGPNPETKLQTLTTRSDQPEEDLSTALLNLCVTSAHIDEQATAPEPAEEPVPAQLDRALNDAFSGLQSHLGPLAEFLESTAEGLRKIAEKTRDADTTPVENILTGFKDIISEVGDLGLKFLATLDEELDKSRSHQADDAFVPYPQSQVLQAPSKSPLLAEQKPLPVPEPVCKKVNFVDTAAYIPPTCTKSLAVESTPQPDFAPSSWTSALPPSSRPLAPTGNPTVLTINPPPVCAKGSLMTTFAPPTHFDPARSSILDWEPSDSQVLNRYPAIQLRKAASVNGLQHKPDLSARQNGTSTSSALSRYPSIGQFEEQTRPKPKSDRASATKDDYRIIDPVWPIPSSLPRKTDKYKVPSVEEMPNQNMSRRSAGSHLPIEEKLTTAVRKLEESMKSYFPSLPGAWPAPRSEDLRTTVDKIPSWQPLPKNTVLPQAHALTQPQAPNFQSSRASGDIFDRAPCLPRKSQTISGTNPAARLNGPFDPLAHIPVLQPRPQVSQPSLSSTQAAPSSTAFATSGMSAPLPRRSQTVHYSDRCKPRDAAVYPYLKPSLWETYEKNKPSTNNTSSSSSPARPWSFYPEATRPQRESSFYDSFQPSPQPPTFSHIRPVKSMGVLRESVGDNAQSFSRPAPPALAPGWKMALPNAATKPATFSTSGSRHSPSILAPCPPAVTSPRGRAGVPAPAPLAVQSVEECVRLLKFMGFGSDPCELARLSVYASAAGGDVEAAVELIEEDREAAKEFDMGSEVSQAGSQRDMKDFEADENPWEE